MTNCRCLFISVLLLSFFASNKTNGQTSSSSDQSASFKNTLTWFQNEIGEDAHLYTGKEYTPYEKGIKGDPFFVSAQMQSSDIFYDGTLYTNIPLLFDIVRQEIVVNRYNQNVRIQLLSEKVKYFTLEGHRFENIALAEGKEEYSSNGIYDVLFDGKASVLVKRIKRIKNPVKAEEPPVFVEEDVFYIRNGNSLYAVDSKGSLLQALNDQREPAKSYLRKNKFRFKKNIEKELIMIAAYYSTLNK
jgi:hypothetical protein